MILIGACWCNACIGGERLGPTSDCENKICWYPWTLQIFLPGMQETI